MNLSIYPFGYSLDIACAKPLTHFESVVELREMFTLFVLPRTRRSKPTSQRRLGAFGLDGANTSVN
ncbi:MAG: hypothetical protein RIR73_2224 [Chloroflexota bacterium]